MALQLTNAQLDEIGGKIYALQDLFFTTLPTPENSTDADSLDAVLAPVAERFPQQGIGVVLFQDGNFFHPRIWLHNPGVVWRIASTGKIAMLLAAVQLRHEVREIQRLGYLKSPAEYDELYAMPKLWNRARHTRADQRVMQIAGRENAPRISTIFEFPGDGSQANFSGPDPDTPDRAGIVRRLKPSPQDHLHWGDVHDFHFSERLWLTGARSDNVAATSCISEIGVPYMKAVQRAYGLCTDQPSDMRMLVASGYTDGIDTSAKVSNESSLTHRPLTKREYQFVNDAVLTPAGVEDHQSTAGGTAAALLAYLIAMQQSSFAPLTVNTHSGDAASATLRACLAGGSPDDFSSLVELGISLATTVTYTRHKIGALGPYDHVATQLFNADFAYVETAEPATNKVMKYGVVATNLYGPDAALTAALLGSSIHTALRDMAP